jgi:putative oxidoreductase
MPTSDHLLNLAHGALGRFDRIGEFLPQLGLRLLLAYEFWQSGLEKWNGMNWFGEIMERFPFPFDVIPVEVSWQISTWSELGGAVALALGFATRFFSASLIVVTLVAWASVHAGLGYNVCDNGWKLPLIYLVMFLPLLFSGPGKLSLDHWVRLRTRRRQHAI